MMDQDCNSTEPTIVSLNTLYIIILSLICIMHVAINIGVGTMGAPGARAPPILWLDIYLLKYH